MVTTPNLLPTDTDNLLWNFQPNRPAKPNVTLGFLGLMMFCYSSTGECEVAFLREPSHKLQISLYEKGNPVAIKEWNLPKDVQLELGVGQKSADVSFYYEGSRSYFDRSRRADEDFRWLLDFESDDGYRITIPKHSPYFKSKLRVRQGTFYTLKTTQSAFIALGGPNLYRPLGQIAKFVAADLEVAAMEDLYLKVDGTDVLSGLIHASKDYEIYFSNECFDATGQKCPGSDFHFFFEALDLPAILRFTLIATYSGRDELPIGLQLQQVYKPLGYDNAPCLGVGFGQSGGF